MIEGVLSKRSRSRDALTAGEIEFESAAV